MSTAFRNFIITFALAAVLFAVVGYLAVNGVLKGLFKNTDPTSEDSTEYSYENAESYYDGEYGESNEEIPSTEEIGDAYMIFYEDQNSELVGAKLLCLNEESGKLVFETFPVDSTIVVNGYNRTVKEIYRSNGEEYLCGKLQFILGVGVKSYVVFDIDSMKKLFTGTTLCKDLEINISCNLPYEVKYENPDMKDYNEQNPDDIQYITLAGETVITAENAPYIFENIPEDPRDVKAASTLFAQIYENVFSTILSKKEFAESSSSVKEFFKCFKRSTLKEENYSVILGIYDGNYSVIGFSELSAMSGKELNWSTLPQALESALKQ